MKKLKIALGDLRHDTIGRHSVYIPIGIGYIASYLLSKFDSNDVEVRLFDEPNKIFKDIADWNPDIIGLSNYCWNTNLSKKVFQYAKNRNPQVICVSGGPEFPTDLKECTDYLLERNEIDFYIYREGEIAFANLIKLIKGGNNINKLKTLAQPGIMNIDPKTKKLIVGEPIPKITNLDDIPSPYLTGLMDKWFDGRYAPSIEMVRGCPFTCAYCKASFSWFSPMAGFSIKRIKRELTYIAQKMRNYPDVLLSICDSNFGMTEEYEEIARHLKKLQNKFNWPNVFGVTTGKTNYDRILRISSLLKNKILITASVQSLNPKTLKIINRRNLPIDQYKELQREIKKMGMSAIAEIIIPMPEETKKSFFDSIKLLLNAGVDYILVYTLMLLRGTPLASQEIRKKYKMQTKFRLLPKQFGEYAGKKSFETEEVCISTNTMSFKDYLDCRGLALLSSLFSDGQFDYIHKHLKEFKINICDYLTKTWGIIKSDEMKISSVYNEYLKETQKELFSSEKEIHKYFSKKENYKKLLTGELGDNLSRKYKTKMLLEYCVPLIKITYRALKDSLKDNLTPEIDESLTAAEKWIIANRNIAKIVKNKSFRKKTRLLKLKYDVNAWYLSNNQKPLTSYRDEVNYKIYCDVNRIERNLDELKKLYGNDIFFCIAKFLLKNGAKELWCKSNIQK